jgi:hypothetical protein
MNELIEIRDLEAGLPWKHRSWETTQDSDDERPEDRNIPCTKVLLQKGYHKNQ